jgi:hypothetical protein
MRKACLILVGNPQEKRKLRKHRCRWKDNIKMDVREIGIEGVNLILLAQNRDRSRTLVNTATYLLLP